MSAKTRALSKMAIELLKTTLQFEPPGDSLYVGFGYKVPPNTAKLRIENAGTEVVLYKLLTNAPYKYRAYVSHGYVEPGCFTIAEVIVDEQVRPTMATIEEEEEGDDDNEDNSSVDEMQELDDVREIHKMQAMMHGQEGTPFRGNNARRMSVFTTQADLHKSVVQHQEKVAPEDERVLIQLTFAPGFIQTTQDLYMFDFERYWRRHVDNGRKPVFERIYEINKPLSEGKPKRNQVAVAPMPPPPVRIDRSKFVTMEFMDFMVKYREDEDPQDEVKYKFPREKQDFCTNLRIFINLFRCGY